MFQSREIDIKLCQNYTKKDICQILYKSCSINMSQQPENLRFAPVTILPFL